MHVLTCTTGKTKEWLTIGNDVVRKDTLQDNLTFHMHNQVSMLTLLFRLYSSEGKYRQQVRDEIDDSVG